MTEKPDLAGFLMAHRAMRQEFGLLARAAREDLSPTRAALFEDQVVLVLESLHHHHTGEDDTIWPWLRERAPHAIPDLGRLESEHELIDPLIVAAGDTSRPIAERADVLAELHELVNRHLDFEESTAVPLVLEHVTAAEWDALGDRMLAEIPKKRLPMAFGWYASASTDAQRAEVLSGLPLPVRLMFRFVWFPKYLKRTAALYGPAQVPQPA